MIPSIWTCGQCPEGTVYNKTTHDCLRHSNATDPALVSNTIGNISNLTKYDIPCPATHPIYFNGSCIYNDCVPPHPLLNLTSLTCTSCPNGTVYNQASSSCVPLHPNATNPAGVNSTIGTTPVVSNPIYCPTSTPFFNGTGCQSCPIATPYFNTLTRTCAACPSGTLLNVTSHACEHLKANASNPAGVNSTIGQLTPPGPHDVACSPSTPFFVNGTCISCPTGTYFVEASKECTSCPPNFEYDANTHSCNYAAPFTNNLAANNWVSTYPTKSITETT